MKTRGFNFQTLISGKVKPTAKVLRGLKNLGNGEGAAIPRPRTGEWIRPKRPEPPVANANSRPVAQHLVFVSLLPGRWVRCAGAAVMCVSLFLTHTTFAARGHEAFDAANAAFTQGKFAEAARGFEAVAASEGFSAPVLYNLANAHLRDGQMGAAILNYERALTLAPRDPDIARNLKLARARAGISAGDPTRLAHFTGLLNLNGWATMAAGALLIASIVLPLRHLLPQVRSSLGLIASIGILALATASYALISRSPELDRAIVIAKSCAVRVSPVTMGEILFSASEGETVTVKKVCGDFAFIESRDGRAGWMKHGEIEPILARESQRSAGK